MAVAAVGLAAIVLAGNAGAATFTDNFNPPSSDWSSQTGSWSASGGDYSNAHPSADPAAATLLNFAVSGADATMEVTTDNWSDGGVLFEDGSNFLKLILGGYGYAVGARGGNAGSSIYWATQDDPAAAYDLVTQVASPGSTQDLKVTDVNGLFTAYLYQSNAWVEETSYDDTAISSFNVALYDAQPEQGGSGRPMSFSDFSLSPAPAPEPASWAMILLGVGAICGALRTQRRGVTPRTSLSRPAEPHRVQSD
jgi:hypothetical protein